MPVPALLGQGSEAALVSPNTLVLGTSGPGGTWLERTALSGKSWSTPFQHHDEGTGLSDLTFVDRRHGAFIYCPVPTAFDYFGPKGVPGGTVYLTDDGGASWRAVGISL